MKKCSKCGVDYPIESFDFKNKKANKRHGYCQNCKREMQSAWYQKNSTRHKHSTAMNTRRYRQENNERVYEYLLRHPCVNCGEKNPIKLEFHHCHNKTETISRMLAGSAWKTIETEIEKCQVLCANCHRFITAKDFNWKIYQIWLENNDGSSRS